MAAGALSVFRCLRPFSVLLGLSVLLVPVPAFQGDAFAQQLIRRQNLFDRLFGGPPPREALPPPNRTRQAPAQRAAPRQRSTAPTTRQRQQQQQRSRTASPAPAAPSPEPTAKKLENARTILVVGDFLAAGLAEGLQTAYEQSPGVRIVNKSNGSSGFVRDDFYDWNEQIGPILEDVDPAVVVVMIGSNDRQSLTVNGRQARPTSEPWLEIYTERVNEFTKAIEEADVPLIWTGLPPFRSSSMSSDMLAFNDIHKQAVETVGGQFIDIWEGFVDENGNYTTTGPDMNGQPVQLRAGDGINLTRAGRRKLAFFVEKPLNRLLGSAVEPDIEELDSDISPPLAEGLQEPANRNRTAPISLAAPQIAHDELAGSAPPAPNAAKTDQELASHPGRADSFAISEDDARNREEETEPTAQRE